MRLLLDEHIDKVVAVKLRSNGFDVIAVTEDERLVASGDADLIDHAFRHRRAIATYSVAHFRVAARERAANEESHFGLVLLSTRRFPQGKRHLGALLAALQKLLEDMPADDALVDREVWPGS